MQPLAGPSYYRPPPIATQQTGNKGVEGPTTRGDGPVLMEIDRRKAGGKKGIKCFNCSKFGHYSNECRSPRRPRGPQNQVRAQETQAIAPTKHKPSAQQTQEVAATKYKPSAQQIRAFISELSLQERDIALDQMIKDRD